ncbi:serine endoprotease [methanotrophic bacterial endosymbiont of Bathymodiolus sp.]|nr:serine endoprotease [methanotrophic bacterial endosymbiont of Bathymodiolus sp.]
MQIQDLSSDLADAMELNGIQGALVSRVTPKSAAEKAGIKAGDVIVAVNGKKITGASSLRTNIRLKRVGEQVNIKFFRDKQPKIVEATIGGAAVPEQLAASSNDMPLLKGAILKELSRKEPYQGVKKGLLITDVQANSPVAQVGLMNGDIILAVNQKEVATIAEFKQAANLSRNQLLIHLQRGQNFLYIVIK